MVLLNTDILTLWLIGQPMVSERIPGSSEDLATTASATSNCARAIRLRSGQ